MADNQQYGPLTPKQTSASDIRKVIANGPKAIGQGSTIATSDELKKKEVDKANSNPKVPTTTKKQSTTTKTNTNVVAPKQTNTVVKKPETQGVNKFASLMQGQISGDLFKNPAAQPINDIKVVKQDNEATHNAAPNNNNDISFMNNFGRAKELKDTVDIDNALMDLYSDIKVKVDNGTLASSDVAKMKQAYPEFANMGDDVLLSMIGDMASIANKKMPFNDVNMKKLKSLYPELNAAAWGFDKGNSENMYQAGGMREQMAQSSKTDLNRFGTAGAVAEGVINPIGEATTLLDMGAQMIPQVDGSGNENRLKKALSKLTDEDINKYYEQYQNYVKNHGTLSKLYTTQLEGDNTIERLWNWATGKGKKDVDAGFREWLIDRVNNEVNGWSGEITGAANELKGVGGPNIAKMYANMPASAVKTVTAITRAITNPIDTAAGLYHLFGTEEGRQALISRYGSWDGFAKALEQDPVGVASDGLAVVEGGAGLTKMAAGGLSKASLLAGLSTEALGAARTTENLLKLATRLENMAIKAGKIEKTAGLASNLGADLPINKVINGLRKWGESGESMIQKVAKYSANASQNGIGTFAGKAIDEGKKIIKEGPINTIANKLMGSASDTDKLFKAASPNLNKLTNNVNYKNKRQNMDIATQAIVDAGYTPKSLSEWAKAHTETLNKKWNEFKKMVKDKSDFEVDVKDLLTEVKDYIKREREGATEAQKSDLRKLEVEVNNIERRGKVDMGFIENRKEHYNSSWRDADKLKVGDIYLKGIKLIGNAMRKQQDNILGKGPEQTKKLRKEIAALMDTKEDVIKADVRNQKKKSDIAGGGLIESYGRLSGLGDFIGGTLSTLTKGGEGLAQAGKGIGKMILGNAMGRARDVDYLTKKGFEGLSNKKKAQNNVGGLKNKFQESKELGELYVERDNLRKELKKDNISNSKKEAINKRLDDVEYAIAQKKARAGLGDKERTLNAENKKKVIDMVTKRAKDVGFTTKVLDGMEKDTQGYTDLRKKLIALEKNPGDTTAQHELFHAFFSVVDKKTKTYILDEAKKILKESGMKDVNAEEWLAESFGIYAKRKQIKLLLIDAPKGFVAKVRDFFQRVYEFMQRFNGDRATINKVFDEVLGDRQMKNGIIDLSDLLGDKEVKVRELGDNGLRNKAVYHGSPADFDKFDSSHMGEGEGAQAHGWGHYVAVDKETAKRYANMRGNGEASYKGKTRQSIKDMAGLQTQEENMALGIMARMEEWGKTFEDARDSMIKDNEGYIKKLEQQIDKKDISWYGSLDYMKEKLKEAKDEIEILNRLDKKDFSKTKRNLYNLEIPDPIKKDTPTGSNYWEESGKISEKQLKEINKEFLKEYGYGDVKNDKNLKPVSEMTNEDIERIIKNADHGIYGKVLEELDIAKRRFQTSFSTLGELFDTQLNGRLKPDDYVNLLTKSGFKPDLDFIHGKDGKEVYRSLERYLGSDKKASQFLEKLGYDGIHYFGGRDGEAYVIFNDDALQIKDHLRYKKKIGNKEVEINKDITSPEQMAKVNSKGLSVIHDFISEKQAEKALDVSKEILDENGNAYLWTHTNKYDAPQFANFENAKDSKYKEFADREIAWFSNSEEMSRSYADSESKLADTKPIKSIEEFNKRFAEYDVDGSKYNKDWREYKYGEGTLAKTDYKVSIDKVGNGYELNQHSKEYHKYKDLDSMRNGWHLDYDGPDEKEMLKAVERKIREDFINDEDFKLYDDVKAYKGKDGYILELTAKKNMGKYKTAEEALANGTAKQHVQGKYHYQGIIQNMKNPLVIDLGKYGNGEIRYGKDVSGKGRFWNDLGSAYDFLKKNEPEQFKKLGDTLEGLKEKRKEYDKKVSELDSKLKEQYDEKHGKYNEAWEEYKNIKDSGGNTDKILEKFYDVQRVAQYWDMFQSIVKEAVTHKLGTSFSSEQSLNFILEDYPEWRKYYDEAVKIQETGLIKESQLNEYLENKIGINKAMMSMLHGISPRNLMSDLGGLEFLKSKELQTNDIVFYALNKGGYDGVLFKDIVDYGGKGTNHKGGDVIAAFNSKQFKAWNNSNPTDSKYISYKKKVSLDKKAEGLSKKDSNGLLAKGRERTLGNDSMRFKKEFSLKEKDAEYEKAVKEGDTEKALGLLRKEAEKKGYKKTEDYKGRGAWSAPSSSVERADFRNTNEIIKRFEEDGDNVNLYTMGKGYNPIGEGMLDHGAEYRYWRSNDGTSENSFRIIRNALDDMERQMKEYGEIKNMPEIEVYRAVPDYKKKWNKLQKDIDVFTFDEEGNPRLINVDKLSKESQDDFYRYSRQYREGIIKESPVKYLYDSLKGSQEIADDWSIKEGMFESGGEWVTPSKRYAQNHGRNRFDGNYKVISEKVPADELWWDGNDINEWGFDDGKDYVVKKGAKNSRKNIEVTYDNKGKLIPLEKRFDENKRDVRFKKKVDQTQTPEFKKWFEGSKVVDKSGKPLEVYHGSRHAGFTEFKPVNSFEDGLYFFSNKRHIASYFGGGDTLWSDKGLQGKFDEAKAKGIDEVKKFAKRYFNTPQEIEVSMNHITPKEAKEFGVEPGYFYHIDDGQVASPIRINGKRTFDKPLSQKEIDDAILREVQSSVDYYGAEDKKKSQVYASYLDIKNPLEVEAKGNKFSHVLNPIDGQYHHVADIAYMAKENGYDGVIIKDVSESPERDLRGDDYIVWDSRQIKSATDNIGTFDKNNPDIRYKKVYHGGGDFDKFDLSHAGEGEGNTAHGWGVYVTENQSRAKEYGNLYRNNKYGLGLWGGNGQFVTYKGKKRPEINGENSALIRQIIQGMQNRNDANPYYSAESQIARVKNGLLEQQNVWQGRGLTNKATKETLEKNIKFLDGLDPKDFKIEDAKRNLYEVDVPDMKKAKTPTGTNYIEETGLITNEAYREINKKLFNETGKRMFSWSPSINGKRLYERLTNVLGSEKQASEFLNDMGYDGIHYIGKVDGSSYVIFNDKGLDIKDHIRYKKGLQKKGNGLHKKSNASILAKGRDRE